MFSISLPTLHAHARKSSFLVFTQLGQVAASAQVEHTQYYPSSNPGWHEHDPIEIWDNTVMCIQEVVNVWKNFNDGKLGTLKLEAMGITNQRETTIVVEG